MKKLFVGMVVLLVLAGVGAGLYLGGVFDRDDPDTGAYVHCPEITYLQGQIAQLKLMIDDLQNQPHSGVEIWQASEHDDFHELILTFVLQNDRVLFAIWDDGHIPGLMQGGFMESADPEIDGVLIFYTAFGVDVYVGYGLVFEQGTWVARYMLHMILCPAGDITVNGRDFEIVDMEQINEEQQLVFERL